MRTPLFAAAAIVLGCGGPAPEVSKATETTVVAEAPLGALKNLAKGLESSNASVRKKAADEIIKLGSPARPLRQSLKKAIEHEPDAAVKAALAAALERTGG